MARVLFVIAKEGFQDRELFDTKGVLESEGHECVIASTEVGECKGALGGTVNATVSLNDASTEGFDAVVFIGGPGANHLKDNHDAVRLAKSFFDEGKVVGAICIAPTILAVAGVLKGKKATVWDGDNKQSGFLAEHGAEYTGDPVTVDGLIVTASGPPAATEFGEALVKVLTENL